mgnify:CR=1 FL=1
MSLRKVGAHYGSRLYVDPLIFRNEVKKFIYQIKHILGSDSQSLQQKHNAFTTYCLTVANYSSGHRPVLDPMAFREDIDLKSGLMMINDKVSTSATERRVVSLSSGAIDVLVAYLSHLLGLAYELDQIDGMAAIANTVHRIVTPVHFAAQPIPLFFYLGPNNEIIRISNSRLRRSYGISWRFETNHNRHHIETSLYEKNLESIFIDCHLGHQNQLSHPLGLNSGLTHAEYSWNVKPLLDELHAESGWEILEGFVDKGFVPKNNKILQRKCRYGYYDRRSRRFKISKHLENEAKEIVLEQIDKSGIEQICKDEKTQKKIIKKYFSRVKIAKSYKRKSINALREQILISAKESNVDVEVQISALEPEESPYKNDRWISDYVTAENLKNTIIKKLTDKPFEPKTIEEGWAVVVVSAVIVGGIYNPKWLAHLLKAGPGVMRKMMSWVMYADIYFKKQAKTEAIGQFSPDYRWHPDSFTKVIILNLTERFNDINKRRYSQKRCIEKFNSIIGGIGIKKRKNENEIKAVSRIMKTYWMRYYPAYIRKIIEGKSTMSPLPEISLARLCYQRRIISSVEESKNSLEASVVLVSGSEQKHSAIDYQYLINEEIRKVAKKDQSKPKIQLDKLREKILLLHLNGCYSEICHALSQWLIHMTIHGTPNRVVPTIATVSRYFSSISRPLFLLVGEKSISEIDEDRMAEIYKSVIEFNKTDGVMRYIALRQFNNVLNDYGLVEIDDLDWSYIAQNLKNIEPSKPDANIVTEIEIKQCLIAISKSVNGKYLESTLSAGVILCYRFGLRVSEMARLRVQDIQIRGKDIIVQVTSTNFGKTKSKNGVRQIPQIAAIPEEEVAIIREQLRIAKIFSLTGLKGLVLFSKADSRQLIDIQWLRRLLLITLRHVCGDPRIRIHHLRHSFITNLYQLIENQKGHNIARILKRLKNGTSSDREIDISSSLRDKSPITLLALLSGHASVVTSIHSYTHVVDDVISGYADSVNIDLDINCAVNLRSQSVETIKNRINKYHLNRTHNPVHGLLKSMIPSEGIKNVKIKFDRFPQRIPLKCEDPEIDLLGIDRLLKLYGIKNNEIQNISHYTGYSVEKINLIVKSAKKLSKNMRVNLYGDITKNINDYWLDESRNTCHIVKYDKEKLRIMSQSFKNISKKPENRILLKKAINEWSGSVLNFENGIVMRFASPYKLNMFLKGMVVLGYKSSSFRAGYSKQLNEDSKSKIISKLESLGIVKISDEKLRRLESGSKNQRLEFADISIDKEGKDKFLPGSTIMLSNVLFLIGTYLKYYSETDSGS